jgi:hypothetical protein
MDEIVCETLEGRRYDAEGRGLAGDVAGNNDHFRPQ